MSPAERASRSRARARVRRPLQVPPRVGPKLVDPVPAPTLDIVSAAKAHRGQLRAR